VKVGLLTAPFSDRPLAEIVPELAARGVRAIELGTGNYPGDSHCPLDELLDNRQAQEALLELVAGHDLEISALSQHGNPLHPRRDVARVTHETWRRTVRLAAQLEVPVVNAFSGCPGDGEEARHPNWVTCAWPPEYLELLEWQWREKVIPYWQAEGRFAARHGVKVAIEMHGGFVVHNPTTLLRLRRTAGESIGSNFDPSHLFWQGIDPVQAIEMLADDGAIFHVHAKDVRISHVATGRKGVLDVEPMTEVERRSWSFCTLGTGHDENVWQGIVDALSAAGYDDVLSIEHEDERLDRDTALRQSIAFLDGIITGRSAARAMTDGRSANTRAVAQLPIEGGIR
jgi:sugar phosphate isomerase/epimerase